MRLSNNRDLTDENGKGVFSLLLLLHHLYILQCPLYECYRVLSVSTPTEDGVYQYKIPSSSMLLLQNKPDDADDVSGEDRKKGKENFRNRIIIN